MFKFNKVTACILFSGVIAGTPAIAVELAAATSSASSSATVTSPKTAPSLHVEINAFVNDYQMALMDIQKKAQRAENAYPGFAELPAHDAAEIYGTPGTHVKFTDGTRHGVFSNKWYIQGDLPDFDVSNGAWELISRTDANGNYLSEAESTGNWDPAIAYVGGTKVKHAIDSVLYLFEARGWVQGEEPILLAAGEPEWKSTWKQIDTLSDDVVTPPVVPVPPTVVPVPPTVVPVPPTVVPVPPPVVPVPPPVIPVPPPELVDPVLPENPDVIPTPPDSGEADLPADSYAFLNEMTEENWEWFFPLRSGKYNEQGDVRNRAPIANPDGSTDVFTLTAFKAAVVEYNLWAKANGYKTFLNEGSKSQQATEFTAFWSKSARETSGTWANAPAPWIVSDKDAGTVWKGALYWTEENGYSTDVNGMSPAINYVDSGSAFQPEPGRSYHGRGPIQLSWNYNYGAFSRWLFDNGMMKDVITEPDTLLKRPDYVANNGKVSMMSAIWFWMTPQEAKPSSHDVIYGDVTNVSQTSSEQGLPPRNDAGEVSVLKGETQDQSVMAYRIGTVINIVNGGLECNNASSWHTGPMQRVSYYNAFAMHINATINGVNVPVIDAATNVWTSNVTPESHDNLKAATCYAQKSYYTW